MPRFSMRRGGTSSGHDIQRRNWGGRGNESLTTRAVSRRLNAVTTGQLTTHYSRPQPALRSPAHMRGQRAIVD
jgi:hypothetical protein